LSRLEQQLPEALGMMVSALRVGHSLVASLGAVAQESSDPIGGEMRKCFDEQNYGVDLRTALLNLIARAPVQDFRIFVAAVLIQKESGGNLAEVLEKVAQTTRERFRLKRQVSVHTAQGRMTGWILSLLPLALGVGMYFVNPDGISVLWKRSIGLKMLCTAIGMDIIGALIIRKIVGIRV
jgi:tight adherence protein B